MRILFLALWLQMSAPQLGAPLFTSEPSVISSADGTIQIGGWPLDDIVLSEIPDESAWGNQANGSCNMGQPVLAQPKAAQRAADETDGKPCPTCVQGPVGGHWSNPPAAEPVDVPAVQETREVDGGQDCNVCKDGSCTAMWCVPHKEKQIFDTCADKSRILEHDENSPSKYWCRKAQQ